MKKKVNKTNRTSKGFGVRGGSQKTTKSAKNVRYNDLLIDDVYLNENKKWLNSNDSDYNDLFI